MSARRLELRPIPTIPTADPEVLFPSYYLCDGYSPESVAMADVGYVVAWSAWTQEAVSAAVYGQRFNASANIIA